MNLHSLQQPEVLIAALMILLPFFYVAFFPGRVSAVAQALPRPLRIASPALLCLPYIFVARAFHIFHWEWLALYALLPAGIAFLLDQAREADIDHRGNWRDFLVLLLLGLAVDLRWFEPAWPHGYAAFGKMLLLDAGIFAFLGVRGLDGVGFDLRMNRNDAIDRTARIRLLRNHRNSAGTLAWLSALPCSLAATFAGDRRLYLHLPLHCRS